MKSQGVGTNNVYIWCCMKLSPRRQVIPCPASPSAGWWKLRAFAGVSSDIYASHAQPSEHIQRLPQVQTAVIRIFYLW